MPNIQRLLVNGRFLEIQFGSTTRLDDNETEHHIVNLSQPLLVSVWSDSSASPQKRHTFGLEFGGTAIVSGALALLLSVDSLGAPLNFTERAFTAEVRSVLKTTTPQQQQQQQQPSTKTSSSSSASLSSLSSSSSSSSSSSPSSSSIGCCDGAAPVDAITERCHTKTRAPTHAPSVIKSMVDVNAFEGHNGETLCVAKKRSKPRSLQSCPVVEFPVGIDVIARRAASGETMWRQCAASFSTMMRHFQKSSSCFKWEPDAERRTIITKTTV